MSGSRLIVSSSRGAYEVRVGEGLLARVGGVVREVSEARTAALVTDANVDALFGDTAESALRAAGMQVARIVVPAGEATKSWARAGELVEAFSDHGLTRDDVVVAVGGGVVGDLAGFCASAYMRGIGVVHVPTTLLAQVDSSIGGKTGVDLPRGKNLAGAYWPPLAVVADTACLATVPDVEWRSGMAEVAKSAILDGEAAVASLEADADDLARRDPTAVERAVLMSAGLKVRVVSSDEREEGPREGLNLGHTLGHAIERVAGYGTVPHGAAVGEGMRFAAWLATSVGYGDRAWEERQGRLLDMLGVARAGCGYPTEDLVAAIRSDKKVRKGSARFVLSARPGTWEARAISDEDLAGALSAWCRDDG